MVSPITISKIYSTLGNSSSLVPIGIKDLSHSAGLTTASYITGDKIEGKDRFIDEFGTQAIWLGGIPFYKKMIDLTLYKIAKHNPKIDIRILKDKEILKKAIEHAPTEAIKESIEKAANKTKTFKGLFMAKFIAATVLTMGSYAALTTFRHKHTEKSIIEEIKKEQSNKTLNQDKTQTQHPQDIKTIDKTQINPKKPSFGMNLGGLKDFMFNPVKNMMIVDGGITAERLAESRNPQDFMGYVIKEGSFWAFMYFAGEAIQKHFEKRALTKHNKSIDLDIKVLQNESFKKAFADKSIKTHLEDFCTKGTDAEIYESLFKKKDNIVVNMAKESSIIKTIKNSEKIDTQQYIDIDRIKSLKTKIEKLHTEFIGQTKENADDFFKSITKLKKYSILKNIGTCMGVLGLVVPGIMLAMRFANKDNKDFAVKKEIEEKLKKEVAAA